ncbi:ribosomal RNA processing protein 1 homolog A-like [Solanum tuberosum]|uniref:Uncharacterized protein n=1 Tax=Solanum tuberosum TaxID=4113 RepID=M1D7I0_SOLTU|nr:PREDICTED: ribosomal RNA processing protein 1 homolog A-like [Solanum tuberosum]
MKTFVQQEVSVSTPSLELLNNGYMVKVDDMNIWTQQRFNPKEQQASQGTTDGYQSEVSYGDESEATDGDKSEASDNHESEATDGNESEATNGDESEATKSQKGEP